MAPDDFVAGDYVRPRMPAIYDAHAWPAGLAGGRLCREVETVTAPADADNKTVMLHPHLARAQQ
jgi:hypothetical protein